MKMKKLSLIALSGLVACSGFALFACGEGKAQQEKSIYEVMTSLVKEVNENHKIDNGKDLFAEINNSQSERIYKFSTFTDNDKFDYCYNQLFTLPMMYISQYHSSLQELSGIKKLSKEVSDEIKTLRKEAGEMLEGFEELKIEYEILSTFQQDTVIYADELQNFRYQATNLISDTYDVAFSLARLEEKQFKSYSSLVNKSYNSEAETTSEETNLDEGLEDGKKLRDYLSLFVGNDYFSLLLKNSRSVDLTGKVNVIKSAHENFESYISDVYNQEAQSLAGENSSQGGAAAYNKKVDKIYGLLDRLAGDREILKTANEKFSIYDYLKNYTGDLPLDISQLEYSKDFADVHGSTINKYYTTNLLNFTEFLKENFIVKN